MVFRKPLTVGQAAEILRVGNKTVLNWIHAGALKAFTTYGGHYRVWPVDLQTFLLSSNMGVPFQFIDERQTTILIMDSDVDYSARLKDAIVKQFNHAAILTTNNPFEGMVLIGEHRPI